MPFVCAVNDTIFRANGKAIIGLSGVARRISLLIKSNFWSTRRIAGSPQIDSGARRGVLFNTNCAFAPVRYEWNSGAAETLFRKHYTLTSLHRPPLLTFSFALLNISIFLFLPPPLPLSYSLYVQTSLSQSFKFRNHMYVRFAAKASERLVVPSTEINVSRACIARTFLRAWNSDLCVFAF